MNISLKAEHQQFIKAQIATGKYTNPEEVIDIAFVLFTTCAYANGSVCEKN